MKLKLLSTLTVLLVSLNTTAIPANLKEVQMPGDGDCLFWSLTARYVAEKDWHKEVHRVRAKKLRQDVAKALESGRYDERLELVLVSDDNPYTNKKDYIKHFKKGLLDPGELELIVASDVLGLNIVVHNDTHGTIGYPIDLHHNVSAHVQYYPGHYNYLAPNINLGGPNG